MNNLNKYLDVSPEVAAALAEGLFPTREQAEAPM